MIRGRSVHLGDRRGGTLVLVALSMVVLLGMGALAVDLAAAFAWRTEAQKIADSSALAGASAFLDFQDAEAPPFAEGRAYEFALRHTIKQVPVDSAEVTVQVITAERKVRVWVNRQRLPSWFARVLGVRSLDVGAMAAAVATDAGSATCLKPIALPDAWDDADDDTNPDNNVWDAGEEWDFDPEAGDRYQRWDDTASAATGYGSGLRTDLNADYGRQIQIKATDPQSEFNAEPGIFFPWRLPPDPDQEECDRGGGGTQDAGAATYRRNICSCNENPVDLFAPYEIQTGNMVGPTFQGISELIDEDPYAEWGQLPNGTFGPRRPNEDGSGWVSAINSPRVVKIALFDPTQIDKSGMTTIEFNNFALMFIEAQRNLQDPVMARFLYFADGQQGPGPETGSLVRYLRLVE